MKKLKKLSRPELTKLKQPFRRAKAPEEKVQEALSNVPRITDQTVTEHREEVLSSARKYIYPLQHSKHRVVRISVAILGAVLVTFLIICALSLYRFQATSGFIYDVTRVVPFPVAKAGGHWVSYESYLFELRRYMHYYRTQQQADFSTPSGKSQLSRLKQRALDQVVQDAYIKQLAGQHKVTVSNQAVNDEVKLVRNQNRLGNNDRVFRDVLSQFWGWDENDFRRELKQQLLTQAVVAKLDRETATKAQLASEQLRKGVDFATLAGQVSEDVATKGNGGTYPNAITVTDRDISPAITDVLFKLQPGQVSGVINTGYTLELVKVLDRSGASLHAAHIQFNLKPINTYVKPLQDKRPAHAYITIK